jgi:hypothetical protein
MRMALSKVQGPLDYTRAPEIPPAMAALLQDH